MKRYMYSWLIRFKSSFRLRWSLAQESETENGIMAEYSLVVKLRRHEGEINGTDPNQRRLYETTAVYN